MDETRKADIVRSLATPAHLYLLLKIVPIKMKLSALVCILEDEKTI